MIQRGVRYIFFLCFIFSIIFISASLVNAATFSFNGTVKDENSNPINNSIVNITIRSMNGWSLVAYNSTTTNASGWFNMTLDCVNACDFSAPLIFEPSILYRNDSVVTYRSKALPGFPAPIMEMVAGTTFYLTPAGTVNITAINSTGGRIAFRYQIKDTRLGYPIASQFDSAVQETVVYMPSNRNYSIMIYPEQSMPVSYDWNNFSSSSSYTFNNGKSSYNATTRVLQKQFNTTLSMVRVSGYINYSSISGWNEFTIVPYLVEPGNMIHADFGDMPYNLSGFGSPTAFPFTDIYNLSTGFFNISLPATVESSAILLFATARNSSSYIGGFRNLSLNYGSYPNGGELTQFNFSALAGLIGHPANVSMDTPSGSQINITTAKRTFALINASNITLGNLSAHIEVTVDYSSLGAFEFTWMNDIAQSQSISTFTIPLLNSTGIKELNVFASGSGGSNEYTPKRTSFTNTQISAGANITLSLFNPSDIEGAVSAGLISIELFVSNISCDVPSPATGCSIGGTKNMNFSDQNAGFDPMQAIMGGGKISFRMGTGNISVHYVNVDLLASGPPDALFDRSTSNTTSGDSFSAAVRFGSGGPTIYDYVLISIPYLEDAGQGLNDSASVNISIPVYYDDNWNVIWNASANGTNAAAFAANYSHYYNKQNEWATLFNQTLCVRGTLVNANTINASSPCYIDTNTNKVWIRLPHFSGTGPQVSGTKIPAAASSSGSQDSSGSSGGDTQEFWKFTIGADDKELTDKGTVTKDLRVKDRLKIKVGGEAHYVGIIALTSTNAIINVSSTPQQVTLMAGESKNFELTNDNYYDIKVTINNLNTLRANISVVAINEIINSTNNTESRVSQDTQNQEESGAGESAAGEADSKAKKFSSTWLVIFIIILVIIVLAVISYLLIKNTKLKDKVKIGEHSKSIKVN